MTEEKKIKEGSFSANPFGGIIPYKETGEEKIKKLEAIFFLMRKERKRLLSAEKTEKLKRMMLDDISSLLNLYAGICRKKRFSPKTLAKIGDINRTNRQKIYGWENEMKAFGIEDLEYHKAVETLTEKEKWDLFFMIIAFVQNKGYGNFVYQYEESNKEDGKYWEIYFKENWSTLLKKIFSLVFGEDFINYLIGLEGVVADSSLEIPIERIAERFKSFSFKWINLDYSK